MTTSTSNFRMIDVSTPEDVADALGQARATLKDAQTEVAFLESLLKATGRTEILGAAFRVKIAYGVETKRTNWQKVAEFFSPPERLVAAHTSSTTSDRLTCSAHTKTAPKSKAKKDTKAAA